MSALHHMPLSPIADVSPAAPPRLSAATPLSLGDLARHPLALVLLGFISVTVTLLSGLVLALLDAPSLPSF